MSYKLPPIPPIILSTNGDTTKTLSDTLVLDAKGVYGCGICQIHGKVVSTNPNETLYLCCDIIAPSYVGEYKIPCLTIVTKKEMAGIVSMTYPKIIWNEVTRRRITSIRLYITNESGQLASLRSCKLDCQLVILPFK